MELYSQPVVDATKSLTLPLDETLIMPIGDVQYGSSACDVDRFKRHIDWGVRNGAYFIGLGDYVDLASPSNRRSLKSMIASEQLYDVAESAIDNAAQSHLEEFQEIVKQTRGRWIGLVRGHHYWPFGDGTTSDMRLANYLGCAYLGDCGIVNVCFADQTKLKNHRKMPSLNIWVHHGTGGGMLQSGPINRLERMAVAWEDVDIFLMGHQHRKVTAKIQRIKPVFRPSGKHRLVHRNIILAGVGGFLKGYMEGNRDSSGSPSGTYVERGMMNPVALGGVVVWARPRYEHDGYATVDIDISI